MMHQQLWMICVNILHAYKLDQHRWLLYIYSYYQYAQDAIQNVSKNRVTYCASSLIMGYGCDKAKKSETLEETKIPCQAN